MLTIATQKAIYATEPMSWVEALLLATLAACAAMAAVIVLYLVKSALGINLMPGPAPLHDLLYPLVRGY